MRDRCDQCRTDKEMLTAAAKSFRRSHEAIGVDKPTAFKIAADLDNKVKGHSVCEKPDCPNLKPTLFEQYPGPWELDAESDVTAIITSDGYSYSIYTIGVAKIVEAVNELWRSDKG